MKKTAKTTRSKTAMPSYDRWFSILTLIFMGLFPFIARLCVLKIPECEQEIFVSTNGLIIDLALFSKEIAIAAFAAIAILFFAGEFIFPDKPRRLDAARMKTLRVPLICIAGMVLLEIISAILSKNRMTALLGVNSEYEGLIALLSYAVLFIIGLVYFNAPYAKKYLQRTIVILSLITGILSFVEIAWKPILEFTFVQHLISSSENYQLAESIRNLYFAGQSSLLFNNPGFLGSFAALLLPIDLAVVLDSEKTFNFRADTVLRIASAGFLSVAMYGSDSKAAWVSLIVSVPIVAAFAFRKHDDKKSMLIRLGITVALAAVLIPSACAIGGFSGKDQASASSDISSEAVSSTSKLFKLDKAELIDGELIFTSGSDSLHLILDVDRVDEYDMTGAKPESFTDCITFTDGTDEITGRIPASIDNDRLDFHIAGIKLDDSRFDAITIATDERMLYMHFGYEGTAQFAMLNGFKAFAQGTETTDFIVQPAVTGFERFYGFATGRGYIWVQSLPILAECLLIGKGCGNFPFSFRQNEIVGLLNTHGSCKYVIDRPHNMYLQYAISNGIPALILMLVLFIWCLIKGFKDRNAGLLAGLLGFMIAAIINDSCITMAPMFWLLLGVMCGNSESTQ